jgi:nitrite reductase (NO-forming)
MKHLQRPLFPFFVWVVILLAFGVSGCRPRPLTAHTADVVFTLKTGLVDGRMAFVGAGGEIEGVTNPDLTARAGEIIRLVIINGDDMLHDLAIPDLNVQSPLVTGREQAAELTFQAGEPGVYVYYCTVSGHRQAGMEGSLIIAPVN